MRRRWRRWLLVLLGLAVAARIALGLGLPWILDRVARGFGMTAVVDGTALSLLGGSFEVRGLRLSDAAAPATPLVTLASARADLDVSALLGLRVRLHDVAVEGLRVAVRRDADGSWRWPALGEGTTEPTAAEPAATAPAPPADRALDFALPVEVESAHLGGVCVEWRDDHVKPPLRTELTLHALVCDVGHRSRPARVELDVAATELLDALRVRAALRPGKRALDLEATVDVRGLRPGAAAAYLEAAGLRPRAARTDARLSLGGQLAPRPDDAAGAAGRFTLSLHVAADGREAVAVDQAEVAIEHVDRTELRVAAVNVRGVRVEAGRSHDGALEVPVLDVVAGETGAPAAPPRPAAPTSNPAPAPFAVGIAQVRLQDLAATFADAALAPPLQLRVSVPSVEVDHVAFGAPATATATEVRARLEVPGVLRTLTVNGAWAPTATGSEGEAQVRGEGVTLAALSPYLAAAGFHPVLDDGTLTLDFAAWAEPHGDGLELPLVALTHLELRDGDRELAALDEARVERVVLDRGRVDVGSVSITGARGHLVREADGALVAIGLRSAAAATAPTPPTQVAAPAPQAAAAPMALSLGELSVRGGPLTFTDRVPARDQATPPDAPPVRLAIDEVALDLRKLSVVDGLPALQSLRASLRSADLVDVVQVDGAAEVEGRTAVVHGTLRAEGLRPQAAGRYARAAGIEATFAKAALQAALGARLTATRDGLEVSGELRDVEFATPEAALVSVAAVRLGPSRLGAGGTELGAVEIERPATWLARAADGTLTAAGFRLVPIAAAPPTAPGPDAAPRHEPPPTRAPLALGGIRLVGAEVQWRDDAVQPPFTAGVRIGAAIDAMPDLGSPVRFTAEAAFLPDAGTLALAGSVEQRGASDLEVLARVRAAGLQLDRLQTYAPPNLRLEPGARAFELEARLAIGPAAAGGTRLDAQVQKVSLTNGDTTLLKLDDLTLRADRLDPAAGVFAIDTLAAHGLEVDAARVEAGTRLLGLTLLAAPAPAEPTAEPASDPAARDTGAVAAESAAPRRRAALPAVSLRHLDLEVARLGWRDETRDSATPLAGSARLYNDAPMQLLAEDLDELAPVTLHLAAAMPPVADALAVDLTWAPAANEPRLDAALAVRGVRPEGLVAVDPELATVIDAAHSSLAEIGVEIAVGLRLPAGGLAALDPATGFGAEVEVRALQARDASGEVLAGVDAVRVDVKRLQPPTGAVHVERLEVEGLRGRVARTADGLSVAGLRLRPPPAREPTPAPDAAPPAGAPPEGTAPAAAPTTAPAGEVRVDTLSVSGLDFVFRDETTSPAVDLPLVDLDVEVKGFSTRALAEPLDVAFQASLEGGKVALPQRDRSSSVLAGVLGAAARAVTGQADRQSVEQRAIFDEIALSGRLQLAPRPRGFVRLDVGALELPALAGLAAGSVVVIGDGVLDGSVRARIDDQGVTHVSMNEVFTDLALSEPAHGPISTYLRLPVPLDAVLFALENEDDEHRVPLSFTVGEQGMSGSQIALAATTALGKLVAEALAAAPLRAAGTVTGLLGLTGGEAAPVPPARIEFVAGDVALPPAAEAAVAEALAQLDAADDGVLVLEHELGADDVPRAAAFASPDPADAMAVANGLRRRAAEVGRERDLLATQARREILTGLDELATVVRLRALEAELHTLDVALGNALDLTGKDAERRAHQRTRAACRALGEQRLGAVTAALVRARGDAIAGRIETRRPRPEPHKDTGTCGRVVLAVRRGASR